jgi:hypothetical protein
LADTIERMLGTDHAVQPLSDVDLVEVLAACERRLRTREVTTSEPMVWSWVHSLAVEARDARAAKR